MTELTAWRQQANQALKLHFTLLTILVIAVTLLGIAFGALNIDLFETLSPLEKSIIYDIRLPRIIMTMTTGAGLAASGLILQAMCRNPLADPGIIGVSSGAALFAAVALLLGNALILPSILSTVFLPIMAFTGALIALVLLIIIATHKGTMNTLVLVLTGVVINAGAATLLGLVTYLADDNTLRLITFWQMGSYSGISWTQSGLASLIILPSVFLFYRLSDKITLLQVSEQHAYFCGVNVGQLKTQLLIVVAGITAISVCFTGIVGFVGLVVPHICRMLISTNIKILLPACILLGGALVTLADLCARLIIIPAELPIGLLTSALGVPFFLWLVIREKRKYAHA